MGGSEGLPQHPACPGRIPSDRLLGHRINARGDEMTVVHSPTPPHRRLFTRHSLCSSPDGPGWPKTRWFRAPQSGRTTDSHAFLALSNATFVLDLLVLSRLFHPTLSCSALLLRLRAPTGPPPSTSASTRRSPVNKHRHVGQPCTALRCTNRPSIFIRSVSSSRCGSPAARAPCNAPLFRHQSQAISSCTKRLRFVSPAVFFVLFFVKTDLDLYKQCFEIAHLTREHPSRLAPKKAL